jgi:hypothetical protein
MPRGDTPRSEQFAWLPEHIAYLRNWWGKPGVSANQIAAHLGTTRSSVIGKSHRLGLPNLGNPVGMGWHKSRELQPREPYQRRDETGAKKVTGVPRGGIRPARIAIVRHDPDLFDGPKPRPSGAKHSIAIRNGIAASVARKAVNSRPTAPLVAAVPRIVRPVADSGKRGVPMADLQPHGCRFAVTPTGVPAHGHLFCNEPSEPGAPYCCEHKRRAWCGFKATPESEAA